MRMLGKFRVVNRHASETDQSLVLSMGELIRWERRKTHWPGWLWGVKETGIAGWIPEAWLAIDGASATLIRDYDATELNVSEGQMLQGELVESGWLLAKDLTGRRGWVPLNCVQPLS